MEQLVIDNGLEFLGTSLENVCISSNVHIVKCPRKKPWYKGKVERFYKTLDDSLTLATPGTTFRNIFDKGDYDPKKHAVVRYSTLKMCIHKWIADVYHQKIHSSLQAKPIDVWNSSIKPENIPLPTSIEELNAILGRSVTRSLSQTGIQVDKLLYNSDELRNLRLKYGTKFDVEVRVDDTDIGRIRVICPKTHRIYTAEAINFDYADGLSSFMHKTIRAGTKAKIGSDDIEAWIDELAEIQQVIDDEVGFKNNNKGVNRARLKESKATSKSPKKGNVSEGHRSEKNRKKETKKNSENLRPSNEHKYRSIEVTDR
jgi:putative transposase